VILYLRLIHRAGVALLAAALLLLNLRFYLPNAADYGPDRIGANVVPQLTFIGAALRDGAGQRMQRLFPEGFVFSHALYGLAWAQVGMGRQIGRCGCINISNGMNSSRRLNIGRRCCVCGVGALCG
jgi:hypothetical protein